MVQKAREANVMAKKTSEHEIGVKSFRLRVEGKRHTKKKKRRQRLSNKRHRAFSGSTDKKQVNIAPINITDSSEKTYY